MNPDGRCISDGHLGCFRRNELLLVGGWCNWDIRSLKEFVLFKLDGLIASSDNNSYKKRFYFFHSRTMHLDIIKVFYLPTDAQENCFKKNIKLYITTALTCLGAITIIRERVIRAF